MEINLNGRKIGNKNPCFITFEAGPTHQGLESAKRLALITKNAGADAIKFQVFDSNRLVSDPFVKFSYEILVNKTTGETKKITEPLKDILVRRDMKLNEWKELKLYCDSIDLLFFATACFYDDVDFLLKIGCQSIKIASADINHIPLIRYVAKTGICIQLDTGMSTIDEISRAVEVIHKEGNNNIIIHHCPSGYPANLNNVNLNMISEIKSRFDCIVAFSDHSPGWDMDIAAIALGAELVEKTITEDRTTPLVEHIMSLEPKETNKFVELVRDLEKAMGKKNRVLSDQELEARKVGRRSLHVIKNLPENHLIKETDLDFRRPGYGIPPDKLQEVINKPLINKKKSGEILNWDDLKK